MKGIVTETDGRLDAKPGPPRKSYLFLSGPRRSFKQLARERLITTSRQE